MSAQVSKTALPQVTDEGGGSEIYESETYTSETIAKWAQVRAYGFTVAGLYLLAPVGLYCELVSGFRLAPLPNAPEHFCGLVAVRGNLIPVYQLEPLLGLPSLPPKYAFVMGANPRQGALLVEQKPQTLNFDSLSEAPVAEGALPDILKGCIRRGFANALATDKPWLLLDHAALFKKLAQRR